jgi:hypothetical protein
MSTCPHCGAIVSADAVECMNCKAALNTPTTAANSQQASSRDAELTLRLEKAMRRTEQLSYAAAGLAIAILGVLIVLSLV